MSTAKDPQICDIVPGLIDWDFFFRTSRIAQVEITEVPMD